MNGLNGYNPDYRPSRQAVGGADTQLLARDMVHMLIEKFSPRVAREVAPERSAVSAWDRYGSTKEFCKDVFRESYDPQIEAVMDAADEYPITIVKSSNGYGKSHAGARIATAMLCRYEKSQVYTAAAPPEANLDMILWGQIKSLVTQHPQVFNQFNVGSGKFIGRKDDPLSFLIGVPIPQSSDPAQRKAKFSGKHAPVLIFILDEGDGIPEEIYEAIESCMSGGSLIRLIVFFNPRADVGTLSRMERNRIGKVVELNALNHVNVVSGDNIFDGAVTREVTVRRINQWTVPLEDGYEPDAECYEIPEYLVGHVAYGQDGVPYPPLKAGWRRVINPAFSYMVLARYPAISENQMVSKAAVEKARLRWDQHVAMFGEISPRAVRPSMGFDVAEYGVDKCVVALKYDDFVPRLKTWGKCDIQESIDKAVLIYRNHRVSYANVDGNGIGAGVAPGMERQRCRDVFGLKVQASPDKKSFNAEQAEIGEFKILRDYMYWSVREWLEAKDSKAMLPPDEELIEEILACTYEVKGKYIQVMGKDKFVEKLKRSPDKFTALALACCGKLDEDGGEIEVDNYIAANQGTRSGIKVAA